MSRIYHERQPFGELLRYWRERRGWSQNTLAKHTGYDHTYISKLESFDERNVALRTPTRNAVEKFADVLALTNEQKLEFFVSAGFYPPNVDGIMLADCDPAVIVLHDLLKQMPAHEASTFSHAMRMLFATYRYETFRWGEYKRPN